MRALVVTPLPPPDPARDRHAVYRRLAMFVSGLHCVCENIEIMHFVPPDQVRSTPLERSESIAFWGSPVTTRLAPLNTERRSWWQAASAPMSLRYRRDFRPFLGPAPANALGTVRTAPPSLIFAHRLPAMVALMRAGQCASPLFFDLDDVEHRVALRSASTASSPARRLRRLLEVPTLVNAERRGLAAAARTFICSSVDKAALKRLRMDVSRTVVVPNAAEFAPRRPPLVAEPTILFLGNFGYAPNAEAAERLIGRIWPRIRAIAPSATLLIAGDKPDRIPSFARRPAGVEFTGFVDDLEALYRRTRLVCCPIVNGGGTRLKLIEAAAYGKPIVATPMAAEGLALQNGREILAHDDDHELAFWCAQLLQRDPLAECIASAAHQTARALYAIEEQPARIADELRAGLAEFCTTAQRHVHPDALAGAPPGLTTSSDPAEERC